MPSMASENLTECKKNIIMALTSWGFGNANVVVSQLTQNLIPKDLQSVIKNTEYLQENILNLMNQHLKFLKNNKPFLDIINMLKLKAIDFNCETVLKLILYFKEVKEVETFCQQLQLAIRQLLPQNDADSLSQDDITKAVGYILALNLQKKSYTDVLWHSLRSHTPLFEKLQIYNHCYRLFASANRDANEDAAASLIRRTLLQRAELMRTEMQRDPEEIARYDTRMLSAQEDKDRCLSDIDSSNPIPLAIVDIGAGGATTFKSVVRLAKEKNVPHISYYGIELEAQELARLNETLNHYTYEGLTASQVLHYATMIHGDALQLSQLIDEAHIANDDKEHYISIILSSVLHEIYSYSHYSAMLNDLDVQTLTPTIENQYNPAVVYKIYYEALKTIRDNPAHGSITIRDGVMYPYPEQPVTFKLHNEDWLEMFKLFLQDRKYKPLATEIPNALFALNQAITLPAKYVQEFMLKANWGVYSFGNEIHEAYCYLTLNDHLKIINAAAASLSMNVTVDSESYIQQGYRDHITQDKIEILSGFGKDKFPPTNMLLKITEKKPELSLEDVQFSARVFS